MKTEEILSGVCDCLSRVVDCEAGSVKAGDRIIEDLGADSLDLLDLIFQLERQFSIKISPGDIERRTRERLGDIPLEKNGVYTPEALEELRQAMPEVPAEEWIDGLQTSELVRVFRAATFANLVERLLEEQNG